MFSHWILRLAIWFAGTLLGVSIGIFLLAQNADTAGHAVLITTAAVSHIVLAAGVISHVQKRWMLVTGLTAGLAVAAFLLALPSLHGNEMGLGLGILFFFSALRLLVIILAFLQTPQLMLPAVLLVWTWDDAILATIAVQHAMPAVATILIGAYASVMAFWAGLWLIRMLLAGSWPIFAIARKLIDEAIRMKISLIFIVLLLLMIPVMAIFGETRLQYQLQTFLSWSFTVASLLLGLMTIFLSCATICTEIDQHQIYLTLTKPIPRSHYLFGKWLGIGLLNLLLLSVACVAIYTFARLIQFTGTPRDSADRTAVTWQLLTARQSVQPTPDSNLFNAMLKARVEEWEKAPSENKDGKAKGSLTAKNFEKIQKTILTKWHTLSGTGPHAFHFHGLASARQQASAARGKREQRQHRRLEHHATVAASPEESAHFRELADAYDAAIRQRAQSIQLRDLAQSLQGTDRSTRLAEARKIHSESFEQLMRIRSEAAKQLDELLVPGAREVIQLRFKPRASGDARNERVAVEIRVNGFLFPQGERSVHTLADNNFHVLSLPTEQAVDSQGKMMLELANRSVSAEPGPDGQPQLVALSMVPGEGLEVLFTAGTFESNVIRCLVMIWTQLCFLSMLGLMAGTFLGFPVACVMCLLVFSAATVGAFLDESLRYYVSIPKASVTFSEQAHSVWNAFVGFLGDGKIWEAVKILVGLVGKGFVAIIPSFHEYNPVPLVTDGRLITMNKVGAAALWVGGVATGCCALAATLIFKFRELARVMV